MGLYIEYFFCLQVDGLITKGAYKEGDYNQDFMLLQSDITSVHYKFDNPDVKSWLP